MLLIGCEAAGSAQTDVQPTKALTAEVEAASPSGESQASDTLEEVLPNGETLPVDSFAIEGSELQLLLQKQVDLQDSIAQETGLHPEDVNVRDAGRPL